MADKTLLWIIGTNIVGLNFWIVKDWLKQRNGNGKPPAHCPDHGAWVVNQEHILKRLDDGDQRMDAMAGHLSNMDINIAQLTTIVDERLPKKKS